LAASSARSAAGSEPQVIPPPTPYTASPVARSMTAVRIATLNRARKGPPGGAIRPMAPQYTPRAPGSSSRMRRIVRCFGAPVTDPHGNSARNTSVSPTSSRARAVISEVSCQTVG
jgi:hypothetical protein